MDNSFKNRRKPELLAPAGNAASARAAVQSGADCVYLGLPSFGARSYAENFTETSFAETVDYCHLRGVKVYVTLNTLVSDTETEEAVKLAAFAAKSGADAVLVQDMGLLALLKKYLPDFPLHISTQAAIMNSASAAFTEKLGASRCLVARELSFDETVSICRNNPGLEIEIFVHGAQCYSYSGLCLMSSFYGGRSGNRGKCAGPCRLPYKLGSGDKKIDEGYLLSPVDMCLGTEIGKVLASGADCLKIEGRMKSPEYVAAVCTAYRKAIDSGKNIDYDELARLESVFSRGGFTSAPFDGKPDVMKKDASNDDAYSKQNAELLKEYAKYSKEDCNFCKTPVEFDFYAKPEGKPKLSVKCGNFSFDVKGENAAVKAENAPLTEERVRIQLEKTGAYPFEAERTGVHFDGNVFMPMSEINGLRRKALDKLSEMIISGYKREVADFKIHTPKSVKRSKTAEFTAFVLNKEQLAAVRKHTEIKEIYCPARLYLKEKDKERLVPAFPPVIREKRLDIYFKLLEQIKKSGADKVYLSDLGLAEKALNLGFKLIGAVDANIFNSYSAEAFKSFGFERITLSSELNLAQLGKIKSEIPLEVIGYGRIALMKTANCPLRGKGYCGKNSVEAVLSDRKGENLGLVCDCDDCTAYILNSQPVFMADKMSELSGKADFVNLMFTTETAKECEKVIDLFKSQSEADFSFTRGHFYKAVK